jgi:hypothetical protein
LQEALRAEGLLKLFLGRSEPLGNEALDLVASDGKSRGICEARSVQVNAMSAVLAVD